LARGLSPKTEGFAGAVLADIDWSQPWFAPWRELGEPTACQALQQQSVAEALNAITYTGKREANAGSGDIASAASVNTTRVGLALGDANEVNFVPQSALPEGQAYEDFIFKTAQVPTRDGLHDFFNGLCWHRFPLAKRRLNQLQAAEIETQGIRATRGPVRDALTLFDENVVLMHAPDEVWTSLQARDWLKLFVDLREQWQQVHLVLFGHALLENSSRRTNPSPVMCTASTATSIRATKLRWMRGWCKTCNPPSSPPNRMSRCPCWACQVGGLPTKTALTTKT